MPKFDILNAIRRSIARHRVPPRLVEDATLGILRQESGRSHRRWDGGIVFRPTGSYVILSFPDVDDSPVDWAATAVAELAGRYVQIRSDVVSALITDYARWRSGDRWPTRLHVDVRELQRCMTLEIAEFAAPSDVDLNFGFPFLDVEQRASDDWIWADAWFEVTVQGWRVTSGVLVG
jgi:hypothetical protein